MRKYRDYLIERLSDREEASAYLQTALEEYQADGDMAAFMLALRSVVEAQGGIQEVARRAHADLQDLLRILSSEDDKQIGSQLVLIVSKAMVMLKEPNARLQKQVVRSLCK